MFEIIFRQLPLSMMLGMTEVRMIFTEFQQSLVTMSLIAQIIHPNLHKNLNKCNIIKLYFLLKNLLKRFLFGTPNWLN